MISNIKKNHPVWLWPWFFSRTICFLLFTLNIFHLFKKLISWALNKNTIFFFVVVVGLKNIKYCVQCTWINSAFPSFWIAPFTFIGIMGGKLQLYFSCLQGYPVLQFSVFLFCLGMELLILITSILDSPSKHSSHHLGNCSLVNITKKYFVTAVTHFSPFST